MLYVASTTIVLCRNYDGLWYWDYI